ncbi:acyl-CoA thioesterase [Nocardia sp. alder85J]|uniref:acyl-CoA thioesterase n=1 Tax=Nocardia sp. alder85J TaxID=2862949 RepID=UPI001CD3DA39|nr:thioesterase family protein [Nocardia sp. alder85J]MCX4095654.1 thioesterase family protein [Nocardia sp. alder85J]
MTSEVRNGERGDSLADFAVAQSMTTRWSDYDMYGHLNNAVYYELFDAAINRNLVIEQTGFDPVAGDVAGVVAESCCRYLRQVTFPDDVLVGLRVERLGNSSVTYDLGLFDVEDPLRPDLAQIAARCRWVHVYVDRESGRPTPIPPGIRTALERYDH